MVGSDNKTKYEFAYLMGQSRPSSSIMATSDEEARSEIAKFLSDCGGTLSGPIKATRTDTWELTLDSPSPAKAA